MKKSFRFRMSRVISSFQWQWQWQSCRSKDPNTLPLNPVPSSSNFIHHHHRHNIEDSIQTRTIQTKQAIIHLRKFSTPMSLPPPMAKPDLSSPKRNGSTTPFSAPYGIRARYPVSEEGSFPGFQWEQEDKWHVLMAPKVYSHRRKVYISYVTTGSSDAEDDVVLTGALHPVKAAVSDHGKKKGQAKNKKRTAKARVSTSSADSCGCFSSHTTEEHFRDFREETKTLVTSPKFISSGSYQKNKRVVLKKSKKKVSKQRQSSLEMMSPESPARLSAFQRFIPCKVEGKVRESLAVVKTSEDPYEDFRRSMMEMILEKNMFEDEYLAQLLQCFLSLNSDQHHEVIIQAFSEIRDALYDSKR